MLEQILFGMDRGNKMWEGHQMILLQHRDLVVEQKQNVRCYFFLAMIIRIHVITNTALMYKMIYMDGTDS